jgi:glutathione synthase/RimK-type ligase-like ATP-grasp enzyme
MILLWGEAEDHPLRATGAALLRQGAAVFFLDQRRIGETWVELREPASGEIHVGSDCCDLSSVTAVYLRNRESRAFVSSAATDPALVGHARAVDEVVSAFLDVTPALLVNAFEAMATNSSKPYQLDLIRAQGFAVPDTLVTTDPAVARDFLERHGELIYKSVSSVRSIVRRLKPDELGRLADIVWCPTQFQQYLRGRDYRVHVIGDAIFCSEVVSDADDYRYSGREGEGVELYASTLPDEIGSRCRALVASLQLAAAGIDLRLTDAGVWVCFEVNPSPAFTYYEAATDQPMADEMANLLINGSAIRSRTIITHEGGDTLLSAQRVVDQSTSQRRPLAGLVSEYDLLELHECEEVRDRVLDLRKYWKTRSQCFFTLGAASYLDAIGGRDAYLAEALEYNQILRSNFDWLWERIRVGLELWLDSPVSLDPQSALPGFHIFLFDGSDQSGNKSSSRAHFDLQWLNAMPGPRPDETLSFTLPLEEPLGGASLDLWPLHHDVVHEGFDVMKFAASHSAETVRYSRGRMLLHDGLRLHAIGQASIAKPEGYRITLQGHGAKNSGIWRLYW